jgi:hypothetical protein
MSGFNVDSLAGMTTGSGGSQKRRRLFGGSQLALLSKSSLHGRSNGPDFVCP